MGTQGNIKAIRTTSRIVEALVELDGGGVSAVAEQTGRPVATVHDHLSTLRETGFVRKRGTEYHVSTRFLEIGTRARRNDDLYAIAKPHVDELADEYEEAVGLLIEEAGYSVLYYAVEREGLDLNLNMGTRVPLNLTAGGKAILACMSDDRVEAIVEDRGLPSLTERSVSDRETLFEELERIRDQKYALAHEENVSGMRGLAVGIDAPGPAVGSILLYGPASRLEDEGMHSAIVDDMRQRKEMIEVNLQAPEIT